MCFTSQPLSTNSTASQSSNSGWVGHSPCEPRSSRLARQALAEERLPQPVHEHARGERVLLRDEPAGEVEARGAAARRCDGAGSAGGRLHDRARLVQPVASRQDAHGVGLLRRRDQRLRDALEEARLARARRREAAARNGEARAPPGDRSPRSGPSAPGSARPGLPAIVQDLLQRLGARLGADRPRLGRRRPCGSGRASGPGRHSGGSRR